MVVVDASPLARIGALGALASPVLSPLAQALVVVVFTAFLLAQKEDLRNRLIKLIGPKDIYRTTEAIDDAGRRIGRMLFAQVLMNSAFGVVIALALWAIGVPNPGLFGTLAGVARFAPYIGVLIGVAPALVVAFAVDPGWSAFLLTLGLFVATEAVAGQLVEPIVYGHSSGLSPAALVVTTALWAFLWGPIGLLLATPLTTCLVVLGRHAPGLAFLETLLGNEPPLTAQEMFYQRLLAGDPREAAAQARPYLKRGAIADYYDEVALEALRRAHVDVARGDLDEGRLAALTQSTQQLVERLSASGAGWAPRLRAFLRRLAGFGAVDSVAQADARQENLLRSQRIVAVLHGGHPLDPPAAAMLRHALTRRGLPSRIVTPEEARMATAAECAAVRLVCLCYIEPLTIAHLRAAAVAARRRCPQAKVMICVWGDDRRRNPSAAWSASCAATPSRPASRRRGRPPLRLLGLKSVASGRSAAAAARGSRAAARGPLESGTAGQQLHHRIGRLQARAFEAGDAAHLDDRADQRLDLRRTAGLDVLQHRGLVRADRLARRRCACRWRSGT